MISHPEPRTSQSLSSVPSLFLLLSSVLNAAGFNENAGYSEKSVKSVFGEEGPEDGDP
jgi:hypothetical protein